MESAWRKSILILYYLFFISSQFCLCLELPQKCHQSGDGDLEGMVVDITGANSGEENQYLFSDFLNLW